MITFQINAVVIDEDGKEVQITHETGLSGTLEDTLVECAMSGLRGWQLIQFRKNKVLYRPVSVVKITAIKEGTYFCKSDHNKEIFTLL